MIVYAVQNKINGKTYVGQTIQSLHRRWRKHVRYAMRGSKQALHYAIRKYGEDAFTKDIIAVAKDKQELDNKERVFIILFSTLQKDIGYNRTAGGEGWHGHHSEETRKILAEKQTGKHHTEETKRRIGNFWKGKKRPPEFGEKQRQSWLTGHRKPCPPSKGHTEKTKEKLRIAHTGKILSLEHRHKMSLAKLGKPWSQKRRRAYDTKLCP